MSNRIAGSRKDPKEMSREELLDDAMALRNQIRARSGDVTAARERFESIKAEAEGRQQPDPDPCGKCGSLPSDDDDCIYCRQPSRPAQDETSMPEDYI